MKTNECAGEGNKITIEREEKKTIEEKLMLPYGTH